MIWTEMNEKTDFTLIILATCGRCFDHNFQRFLPIFGEKIGVFLKSQYYDQILQKLAVV
jgi:hypothetical protein